jgi:hypothetical protein
VRPSVEKASSNRDKRAEGVSLAARTCLESELATSEDSAHLALHPWSLAPGAWLGIIARQGKARLGNAGRRQAGDGWAEKMVGIERSARCRSREPEPEAGGTPGGGLFGTPSLRDLVAAWVGPEA